MSASAGDGAGRFSRKYLYSRMTASRLGSNDGRTSLTSSTEMSGGVRAFRPFIHLPVSIPAPASKAATCPAAWTPASVLPAPHVSTLSPASVASASSRAPCTVRASGCF